jgi:hypothetical protein
MRPPAKTAGYPNMVRVSTPVSRRVALPKSVTSAAGGLLQGRMVHARGRAGGRPGSESALAMATGSMRSAGSNPKTAP